MTILRTHELTKDYQARVLHGIDLAISPGQFVTIMGPSGSGKSTLLHLLSGMDTPTSGRVFLGEDELTALGEADLADLRLRRLGFVFQEPHLLRKLTLRDNIVLPGFLADDEPRETVVARADALLERLGIAELADRDVTQASGGQLQRIGICRALINTPEVIFGDEPTGALNSSTAAQILDIFGEVNEDGTTIVLVTHDPQVAVRGDRVVMLVDGRISDDLDLGRFAPEDRAERLQRVSALMATRGI